MTREKIGKASLAASTRVRGDKAPVTGYPETGIGPIKTMREFPEIGDPNILPQIVGSLFIRTLK